MDKKHTASGISGGIFQIGLGVLLMTDWWWPGIRLVTGFFSIFGEEFFWRGKMLPKMNDVFGKWDGVANGVSSGLYYLSQHWQILGEGIFM